MEEVHVCGGNQNTIADKCDTEGRNNGANKRLEHRNVPGNGESGSAEASITNTSVGVKGATWKRSTHREDYRNANVPERTTYRIGGTFRRVA